MERGDAVVVQASSAARLAYEQGDFGQAQQLYRRALTRAQAINDARLAADAAYNLAMSEIGLGDYDAADQLLRQAYYDADRASSNTADIQLVRAKVAFLRMRLPEALTLLDEIVASKSAQSLHLQAMILRGQIFCDTGDPDAAKSELTGHRKACRVFQDDSLALHWRRSGKARGHIGPTGRKGGHRSTFL